MAVAGKSSPLKRAANFFRKNRKCPTPLISRTHFQESFHKQQQQRRAMKSLLHLASKTSAGNAADDDPERPRLLSTLTDSFSARRCNPTPKAYAFILKTLFDSSKFSHIPAVLGRLRAAEKFETPESVLIDVMMSLCDADRAHEAVRLFRDIPKFRCVPSVLSLNALLSALSMTRQGLEFIPEVLFMSWEMNIRIEDSSFRILIDALCRSGRVDHAVHLLRFAIADELTVDVRSCSKILAFLCQNDHSSFDVVGFLEEMRKLGFCPSLGDYSNVIKYLVKIGRGRDAFNALNQMKLDGIKPDCACYASVLAGFIEEEDYKMMEKLFDELLVLGLVPDMSTYHVYIRGLCKQQRLEGAIAMTGFMNDLGCRPDEEAYEIIFEALCQGRELGRAIQLRKEIRNKGVGLNWSTHLTLLDSFVCEGRIADACNLLQEVLDKTLHIDDPNVTDEVLCGLCERALVSRSPELLDTILGRGVVPGAVAWDALLRRFISQISLLEKSRTILNSWQV